MTENQYQRAAEVAIQLGDFVAEKAVNEKDALNDKNVGERTGKTFGGDIKFEYAPKFNDEDFDAEESSPLSLVDPSASTSDAIQAANALPVDAHWLEERCMEYVLRVGSCPFSPQELCLQLLELLGSSRDTLALQNELFNLLGVDAFDFISMLIQKRVTHLVFWKPYIS